LRMRTRWGGFAVRTRTDFEGFAKAVVREKHYPIFESPPLDFFLRDLNLLNRSQ
jgi:hypothetical protein